MHNTFLITLVILTVNRSFPNALIFRACIEVEDVVAQWVVASVVGVASDVDVVAEVMAHQEVAEGKFQWASLTSCITNGRSGIEVDVVLVVVAVINTRRTSRPWGAFNMRHQVFYNGLCACYGKAALFLAAHSLSSGVIEVANTLHFSSLV